MQNETQIKRNFKIRLYNGKTLSYNSIDNIFKNIFKCNMFASDIKMLYNKNTYPILHLELNCNINKCHSVDLLFEILPNYFSGYNLTRHKDVKHLSLKTELLIREECFHKDNNIDLLCEENNVVKNEDNKFSIFIDNIELTTDNIRNYLQENFKTEIKEVIGFSTDNFKEFTFYINEKVKYNLNYLELCKLTI